MSDLEELGSRIRRQRRRLGISQANLAGDELSHSYVSLLEAGKRTPSPEVLRRLAERLECEPEYLLSCLSRRRPDGLELELGYAEMALANGEPQAALDAFTAAHDRAGESESDRRTAQFGIARSLEGLGELERAVTHYEDLRGHGLHRCATPSDLQVTVALCRCYRELGDLTRGVELAEGELAELERAGVPLPVVGVELLSTLVGLYCERGDVTRAAYLASQALERAQGLTDSRALGAAYWNASMVAAEAGRPSDALAFIRRALALYAEGENERALARLRNAYATVLLGMETPDAAAAKDLLVQASEQIAMHGSAVDMAYCRTGLAQAQLVLGEYADAVAQARRALELLGSAHRLQSARALLVLASAELRQSHPEQAKHACERAALMLEASGASRQAGFAWAELAEVLDASGDSRRALAAYRQSLRCLGHQSTPLGPRGQQGRQVAERS